GVPVLAANVGGIPDLIQDGATGMLCDPKSATSMAAGVQRLLSSEALCTQLSQNGRDQAAKKFHPAVVAERHVAIYEEVLREARLHFDFP
ncbi:MAG: glycosyltransferase, partial [Limisphaerales bacterium]